MAKQKTNPEVQDEELQVTETTTEEQPAKSKKEKSGKFIRCEEWKVESDGKGGFNRVKLIKTLSIPSAAQIKVLNDQIKNSLVEYVPVKKEG